MKRAEHVDSRRTTTQPQWGWLLRLAFRIVYVMTAAYRRVDRVLARLGASSIDGTPEEEGFDDIRPEPDGSMGPILQCQDAPRLFEILDRLATKLGCPTPAEVRLTYLPMCGVLEMPTREVYTKQVLVLGLPCLHIWSRHELKAALAHELAHLLHRDAVFVRDVLEFVVRLRDRLSSSREKSVRFCSRRFLAGLYVRVAGSMAAYVSRGMEFRADQWSARTYGSGALSTALEKLAVVQPVFREILSMAGRADAPNVYRIFARAWTGLNGERYERLREKMLDASKFERFGHHPPVALRLEKLRKLRQGKRRQFYPSLHLLDDPTLLERLLHNRLYRVNPKRPSVFRPLTIPTSRAAEPAMKLGFV